MIDFKMPEGFVAAGIGGVCLPICHIILLGICGKRKEKYVNLIMVASFCLSIIIWLTLIIVLAEDSFPDCFYNLIQSNGFIDGLFVLGFFFIGYIEFYSLIRRGYSLRILYELYLNGSPMSFDEIKDNYSGGRGLDWFLKKRLHGIESIGLINICDEKVRLSKKGVILAKIVHSAVKVIGLKDLG